MCYRLCSCRCLWIFFNGRLEWFYKEGCCAPTACTNLLYYWYLRNTNLYKRVKTKNWQKTFDILHEYMYCDPINGTQRCNIAPAMKKYLKEVGFLGCSTTYGDQKVTKLKQLIDADKPFIINVINHPKYKNHSMLVLGYQEFFYEGTSKTSVYFRVADGWNKFPTRFIWASQSTYNTVLVKIK